MKKTTSKPAANKTAAKKPVAKMPAAKKSPAKPKRKAEGQPEFVGILTRLAEDQRKLAERLAHLMATTDKLVEAVGHLSEGVEDLLQASEGTSPAQAGEPANERQIEEPGEVVGVMMVDDIEGSDGEGEEE